MCPPSECVQVEVEEAIEGPDGSGKVAAVRGTGIGSALRGKPAACKDSIAARISLDSGESLASRAGFVYQ